MVEDIFCDIACFVMDVAAMGVTPLARTISFAMSIAVDFAQAGLPTKHT